MAPIIIDENILINYINFQEWDELQRYLNNKFKISFNNCTNEPEPLEVTETTVAILSSTLQKLSGLINEKNVNVFIALKMLYKSLRNCLVVNSVAQDLIIKDVRILNNTLEALNTFLNLKIDTSDDCITMVVQFLSNLIAKNPSNALTIWKTYSEIILNLYKIPKFAYHSSALLYNILCKNNDLICLCEDIYEYVAEMCTDESRNEFNVYLLELFVQNVNFFLKYYTFKPVVRMTILTLIIENDLPSKNGCFPHSEVILEIATEFKKKSDCILKTVTNYVEQIEPEEVVLLLEILAKLSSNEDHCKHLQRDKGLLINCAFLLRSIHSLGKASENKFTAIPKLSDVISSNDNINKDPTFGFKANLIRLLGNLCWKHCNNQDQVRELDCIPLLLDCCNIDARNPFIIQWSIFAIRNLCENNKENQAVIAGMNQQGVVDSSTLHEMGLMLHNDGNNKIGIIPLDLVKK